jgi:hypothetical protein
MSESKEVENEGTSLASAGERTLPLTRKKIMVRWFEVITTIMVGVVAIATAGAAFRQLAGTVIRLQSTFKRAIYGLNQPVSRRKPGRSRCTTPASSTSG